MSFGVQGEILEFSQDGKFSKDTSHVFQERWNETVYRMITSNRKTFSTKTTKATTVKLGYLDLPIESLGRSGYQKVRANRSEFPLLH